MKAPRQKFETKIFYKDKIYLPASDCAAALGYDTVEIFTRENLGLVVTVSGISELVSEENYNKLLVRNPKAFGAQIHIEMTKVSTLNAEISTLSSMYPLKVALAGPVFEQKAREKNCESVEEYINRFDFPEESAAILKDFKKAAAESEHYDKEVELIRNEKVFPPKMLKKYGITVQTLTDIEDGKLSLQAFLAGNGFFYQIGPYDDYEEYYLDSDGELVENREDAARIEIWCGDEKYSDLYVNEGGEFCIPVYDEGTGGSMLKNIGRTEEERDFRKYSVFENIMWALQHTKQYKDSMDMAFYNSSGISMYLDDELVINLAFQNNPKHILIDGIIGYDIKTKITKISGLPVFYHETVAEE